MIMGPDDTSAVTVLDELVARRLLMVAEEFAFSRTLHELPVHLRVPPTTIASADALNPHEAPLHVTVPANDIEQAEPTHVKPSWFDDAVTELPDSRVTMDSTDDMLRSGVLIDEPDVIVSCLVVVDSGSAPADASRSIVVSDVVVSIEPWRVSD